MKSIINLGIWNNKKYHFDWENKILMEEVSTPSNWYYVWVPITLFLIDKISALITQIGLLENMLIRVFLVVFLSLPAYFSAKLIIGYYHSSLKLKRSELEGAQKEAFIKGLKRRKVFLQLILSFFIIATPISVALFIIEKEVKAVIFCFLSLLIIFMSRFDFQFRKWPAIMQLLVEEKKASERNVS